MIQEASRSTGPRSTPWRIAARVARHTAREAMSDKVKFVASGVAFRVALAVFPAVALLVWLGSRVLGAQDVRDLLQTVLQAVPDSTRRIVQKAVDASMSQNPAEREGGWLGPAAPLLGLGFTLWSANSGMRALFKALRLIFDAPEHRPWHRYTALTLAFTLAALVALVGTMGLALLLPYVLPGDGLAAVLAPLRWPILFGALALGLSVLYRVAPGGRRKEWPFLTLGSGAAALLLLLDCALFSWFTGRFASLAVTYGSLSTVAAFLLWLWSACVVVLVSAELDAAIDAETGLYGGDGGRERSEAEAAAPARRE